MLAQYEQGFADDPAWDVPPDVTGPAGGERVIFRPSRTAYPGSKFGPKTRYDLPRRHKAYGNGDEAEALLFQGTSLQPLGASLHGPLALRDAGSLATPRHNGVLTEVARSMMHPLAERNLPELPLVGESNDVHGVLVLGAKGAGKTSVVVSLLAAATGHFPTRRDTNMQDKMKAMPHQGQSYEFPEQDITHRDGTVRPMRVLLTDTPACGTSAREEMPLCTSVSPNSVHFFSAIPSWMRITLRSGNFPHYTVLYVIDATAKPLWEDSARCRELVRLLAVLRRNHYTVVLAVAKMDLARQLALRGARHGHDHAGQVGRDPRSSYEGFASRYLEKCCAAIHSKAKENDWSLSVGADALAFPLVNVTMFDAPTWTSIAEFNKTKDIKGCQTFPNNRYISGQLKRLTMALCQRSHDD